MANLRKNDPANILGPLGSPFRLPAKSEKTVVVAGGVGFPPLLFLVSEMVKKNYDPRQIEFFYGGRTRNDIIERSRIKRLGVHFTPVSEDGSYGEKGLVTEPVQRFITDHEGEKLRIYGCGPQAMLRATDRIGCKLGIPGQISLEAPMPCGIGVCLGCVVPLVAGGHARVCHDGPVFNIGEVAL